MKRVGNGRKRMRNSGQWGKCRGILDTVEDWLICRIAWESKSSGIWKVYRGAQKRGAVGRHRPVLSTSRGIVEDGCLVRNGTTVT